MATVRFSKEFKDSILRNARAVFDKRISDAENTNHFSNWGDRLYDIVFEPYVASLNNLPIEFFSTSDVLSFQGFFNISTSTEQEYLRDINISLKLSTKRPFPHEVINGRPYKKDRWSNYEIKIEDIPEVAEFKQLVVDWKTKCIEIRKQRDEFVSAVDKVIESHATLAPALKMWPPLWDLVNEEYRDRHREVVERVKPSEKVQALEEEGINLSALTATVVAHKLTK